MTDNIVINSLWIGSHLSILELLTIKSFLQKDHEFHLWAYDNIDNLPEGIIIRDANGIIEREKIFKYKYNSIQGIGKGSYAGFSDIFRFKLLSIVGGWWIDMDVTCLRYFDIDAPYLFPRSLDMNLATNVIKCPGNSKLMESCYNRAIKEITENNTDYTVPVRILNEEVKKLGLTKFIVKNFVTFDSYVILSTNLHFDLPINKNIYAIHWCNVIWSTYHLDKEKFNPKSLFGSLILKYGVASEAEAIENEKIHLSKRLQKHLFYFLAKNQFLLIILKRIKRRFSNKFNVWN
jgi:hypothetical protein